MSGDEELRALAEAAMCERPEQCAAGGRCRDGSPYFIAAANPTAVLALLDRVEAAEAAVERVRVLADEWAVEDEGDLPTGDRLAELRAALEGR